MKLAMSRAITAVTAFGLGIGSAFAAPPGVEIADYRGSSTVLLRAPSLSITEREALLYALETESLDPNLLKNWKTLGPNERARVRFALESQLRTLLLERETAKAPKIEAPFQLRERATRILAARCAEWLWADSVVRESVTVFPEDVLYQFKDHLDRYVDRDVAVVRRLRVPLSSSAGLEELDAARAKAESLRAKALKEGGLAPILAAQPELMLDRPGEVAEIARGAADVDEQIADAAFKLGMTQISEPLRTPGGFVLVELVERRDAPTTTLEEIRPKIDKYLQDTLLPQQYDYLLNKQLLDASITNRASFYEFMPADADIVRVRNFAITVEELNRLYPEVLLGEKKLARRAVGGLCAKIISGELATAALEKAGNINDPFYREGVALAERLFETSEHIRAVRAEIDPTAADVQKYLASGASTLRPGPARILWRYAISPRDDKKLTAGEADSLRIRMIRYLSDLTELATQQMEERRRIAGERGVIDPSSAVNNLPPPEDPRVRVKFERIGPYTKRSAKEQLGVSFDSLRLGEFTKATREPDGTVVSYFFSEEIPEEAVDEDVLTEEARKALIIELSDTPVTEQLNRMKQEQTLRYAVELQ